MAAEHAEARTWAADNDVELVLLPTYGSWPNWIESEFAALRYCVLNGTDHRTHDEQTAAIAAHLRRRDSWPRSKSDSAPESSIRRWTAYPAKVSGRAGKDQFPDGGL
ncbi:hypothetical protein ABT030_50310 [Streptomyces mirabilis]|uniref:hypothetical protein n=1 Tax=Streptomyces mirabilis TaxID=68239 RepID=UPI003319BC85